jgi:hypothetical protein
MSEAERLIRGLLELLDVVLHSGQVPRSTELLLEDVRLWLRSQRYRPRAHKPFSVIKGGRNERDRRSMRRTDWKE